MIKRNGKEILLVLTFVFLFIFIRSINFAEFLNFSYDQGSGAAHVLEIWKNKEITLVGPGTSLIANNKPILQGSIMIYFNLLFLLVGNWDPIKSSYAFMVFTGVMIAPLYVGVKLLINNKAAIFVAIIYSFLPLYVNFTRFFFGPNFQLSLTPILILLMGLYRQKPKSLYLLLIFISVGILVQFHYQFLIVTAGIAIYYLLSQKSKAKTLMVMTLGFIIGFSPMIIFEIKNNFYNLRVLSEYLQTSKRISDFNLIPHRYLSISFISLIPLAWFIRKSVNKKLLFLVGAILIIWDLTLYLPKPKNAFGMAPNWNYLMEKKTYKIIKKENLKDFNIVNRAYDNLSVVIKYQMKLDNYVINYDDYYHNNYLYVISKNENVFSDPAYELNTFKPNKKIKKWGLNNYYNLYLFQRVRK